MAGSHIHLMGSVGLDSAEEVFAITGWLSGEHLQHVPNGEPGATHVDQLAVSAVALIVIPAPRCRRQTRGRHAREARLVSEFLGGQEKRALPTQRTMPR